MVCTIKIASFDVSKWYTGRETPIKANNISALIGATQELNKHKELSNSLTNVMIDMQQLQTIASKCNTKQKHDNPFSYVAFH